MLAAVSKMEVVSILTELKVQWVFSHQRGSNGKLSEMLGKKATQTHSDLPRHLKGLSLKKQHISSLLKD